MLANSGNTLLKKGKDMETTTFLIYIFTFIILYLAFAILYIVRGGRINMDYRLALKNLFEMVEIVLYCIFTITHLIGSIILFISTLCIRKLGHPDSHHTVDIGVFGYKYTLTTKK